MSERAGTPADQVPQWCAPDYYIEPPVGLDAAGERRLLQFGQPTPEWDDVGKDGVFADLGLELLKAVGDAVNPLDKELGLAQCREWHRFDSEPLFRGGTPHIGPPDTVAPEADPWADVSLTE